MSNERSPLLEKAASQQRSNDTGSTEQPSEVDNDRILHVPVLTTTMSTWRYQCFAFLEAHTPLGLLYERFMIVLIGLNVATLIVGSLCIERYNNVDDAPALIRTMCRSRAWDTLWFGNHGDNGLSALQIGATSVLEVVTVLVFTVDYAFRLWTADFLTSTSNYAGWWGRCKWSCSFYSMVDLVSIVPFYIDALVWRHSEVSAVSFVRMFRLVRMMRARSNPNTENRYDSAWNMIDDVVQAQQGVLLTTGFVGFTIWMAVSSLYYLAEHRNLAMIYCPTCDDENVTAIQDPTKDCQLDQWGNVVGCAPSCVGCYHLYESIPMASYYALLNLFGEFPLINLHSAAGKVVATLTTVVAVAVFALPVGIIGNGIKDAIIAQRRNNDIGNVKAENVEDEVGITRGFRAVDSTLRSRLYNLLHSQTAHGALAFDSFINILIVATALSFMLDTIASLPPMAHVFFDSFELISVIIFTIEYALRVYSAKEDPKYKGPGGRIKYMVTFLALVDLLSFLPYWLAIFWMGRRIISSSSSIGSDIVKSLRLLRILRFERYTHAFLTFDDALALNRDLLAVTALTAVLFWVFFSVCLYWSERDSLDAEMAANYNTIPNSMWITLLNLSGESPLSQYSAWGKLATAILGLVATGYVSDLGIALNDAPRFVGIGRMLTNELPAEFLVYQSACSGLDLKKSYRAKTETILENLNEAALAVELQTWR
jgi:Ion transport protein